DLILLGMGADGHTAPLFPGTAALDAPPERWFVHNHVPQLDTDRLTTTFTFLRAAHRVVFLVAGEGKAEALRQVLEPREGEEPLPAARVMGGQAEVTWLVDAAAASLLAPSADQVPAHVCGESGRGPRLVVPSDTPSVCVFAPSILVTATIEPGDEDFGDIHFHLGGQGYWVARLVRDLGERPILV